MLPNALVQDVRDDAVDDVLLAGTFGRGTWTIPTASAVIASQGVLQIDGDMDFAGEDDVIRLVRDGTNPLLLHVFLNGVEPAGSPFPLDGLGQINVNGFGGRDTLIVDSSNGLVNVDLGIRFDGGTGFDQLQLVQMGGDLQTSETLAPGATPGSGRSIIVGDSGTQIVDFENLEPVLTNVPVMDFTVAAIPGLASLLQDDNQITYLTGTLLANSGRLEIDNFEPIEFSNKTNLIVDAGSGDDTIVTNTGFLPDALETITFNAGAGDDNVQLDDLPLPAAGLMMFTVNGGVGDDVIDGSQIISTPLRLFGDAGNDRLTGGESNDLLTGGAGDDTLVDNQGKDTYDGSSGIDTILVNGTALADVITLDQPTATSLVVNLNGNSFEKAARGIEIVRVAAGGGDDVIGVNVSDTLIMPGPPDTDMGSFAFRIDGGSPNASDRLVVSRRRHGRPRRPPTRRRRPQRIGKGRSADAGRL